MDMATVTNLSQLLVMDQPENMVVTNMTEFGVMDIMSQVTLRDLMDITLRSMELMTLPGDQMALPMLILTMMTSTIGMTKVMHTFAMPVEVMDALSAVDMDTSTREELSDTTDTTSRWDSELDTLTLTLERSQDHHTTDTSTESVVVIPKDGPMDMEEDTDSDTERDTDLPTDGLCTMDMDTETQAPRDQFWDMVLVLMLLFHNCMILQTPTVTNQSLRRKFTSRTTMRSHTREVLDITRDTTNQPTKELDISVRPSLEADVTSTRKTRDFLMNPSGEETSSILTLLEAMVSPQVGKTM